MNEQNKCIDLHGFAPARYSHQWHTKPQGLFQKLKLLVFLPSSLPPPFIMYGCPYLKHEGEAVKLLSVLKSGSIKGQCT